MTEQPMPGPEELVRSQTFPVEGPLELDVDIPVGRVEITLAEGDAVAEIRHDPSAAAPWTEGVTSLLSWVGERFGSQLPFGTELSTSPAEAVEQARIELTGNRLVVRAPKQLPLRNVPLAVAVHVPDGSHLNVRTGTADVTVTGPAGRVDLGTGSGTVTVERADGAAVVRTGSGSIKLGPVPGGLHARSGSGDIELSALAASATVASGSGDVWLGETSGEVLVRTSSGDLTVADAASGSLEAVTGSGQIRVAIRTGVAAEIDLSSGSGRVSSELDVADTPPDNPIALTVRARSGSGDTAITRAAG
ncbi:DUF4097 family beta strand repeat-containing protein [Prauserella muralis]|uniref:DUF4097 domain-containing protein n=1 Tax=Prauserella muralis TaxID=588067 RepID=A0A2V4B1X4_9PSEU|nr:DUF4097 family beta strand repeat-containing protein [Prauserella muralis]PXY27992.1 hypothetical protein BAY60_16735 [Prauserella muralis]TWE22219.1 putative adhesin [Prauserella muralis]